MKLSRLLLVLVILGILLFTLFEVRFPLVFAGTVQTEMLDPEVEAAYEQCYADRDEAIHETAFGTIDNPDVQREFITSSRIAARTECRELFPQKTILQTDERSMNLIDLNPRFW